MRQYVEEVTTVLKKQSQIRNISIIAHVDHGKTTLVDSLLAKAGIIKEENSDKLRVMDTKVEEQDERTIMWNGISLLFKHDDGEKYVVNLVDSPEHVDFFSSEVTEALRITDGALIVVDCIEGVCVQTETVTRQALGEKIKPVLHVNNMHRGIMEFSFTSEELYQILDSIIQNVNAVLMFYDESMGDILVDPRKGTVSFGSGKQGWAFTLPLFAKVIGEKTGKNPKYIMKRLWGDNFYCPDSKKFYSSNISPVTGKKIERYVCSVVFNPILKLVSAIKNGDMESLDKMLGAIGVKLSKEEREMRSQEMISRVMQLWLPAGDTLSKMIIDHLPSPVVAQKYRVDALYSGPLDDECANAIRNCDPNGPLMMFISKKVPRSDFKRFYAFGRVFSGTLKPQQEVRLMGPYFVFGEKIWTKKVPQVALMMGKYIEDVQEVQCGNTASIVGIDNYLVRTGTVSSSEVAHSIAPKKFPLSPVVRYAVSPKNAAQLPKFVAGLKRLESDPRLQVIINEKYGECIVAGVRELHVEVSLDELRESLGKDVEFNVSPPIIEFCESVRQHSSVVCMSKSPNKHNRLYITAEPLSEDLVNALEAGKINLKDKKILAKQLQTFGWDQTEAKKLWFFSGTNCVVDTTKSVQHLSEIKDHISASFNWVVREGALCEEPMRGIRFNIVDVVLHSDTIHRGGGQLIPAARRAFLAAQLSASPCLVEQVYLAEIQTEQEMISKICSVLRDRRGFVIEENAKGSRKLYTLKAHLPVLASIGFDSDLRDATSGRAFPQLAFSHWQAVEGDPFESGILANEIVLGVRERKQLKNTLPVLEDFNDKL